MRVAQAYEALAGSGKLPAAEARRQWDAARAMYVRSLEIWQDMQRRGILTGEDASIPDEVTRRIARCEESLRDLAAALRGQRLRRV